jgi:hypothetical protein
MKTMPMERELRAFLKALPTLLQGGHEGGYALIHGDAVDSLWDTVDAALSAGYERFGVDPFLIQEITEHERPKFFSRNVARCP